MIKSKYLRVKVEGVIEVLDELKVKIQSLKEEIDEMGVSL